MSVPIASAAPQTGDHKHCEACGKSIGLDGRVCSPECVTKFDEAVKMRKRSVWMVMGAVALILLFQLYSDQIFGAGP